MTAGTPVLGFCCAALAARADSAPTTTLSVAPGGRCWALPLLLGGCSASCAAADGCSACKRRAGGGGGGTLWCLLHCGGSTRLQIDPARGPAHPCLLQRPPASGLALSQGVLQQGLHHSRVFPVDRGQVRLLIILADGSGTTLAPAGSPHLVPPCKRCSSPPQHGDLAGTFWDKQESARRQPSCDATCTSVSCYLFCLGLHLL